MSPHHRPLGHISFLGVVIMIAALALLLAIRAVAPLKERFEEVPIAPTTTSTVATVPQKPLPSVKPAALPLAEPAPIVARPAPEGALCDAQHFICVNLPSSNLLVSNPTVVQGTAIAFENTFQWRLETATGRLLSQGFSTTNATDVGKAGEFSLKAFWEAVPDATTGTLVVFESSARDGEMIHVVRVPVKLTQETLVKRTVYLTPIPAPEDCTKMVAVKEQGISSKTPIEATLQALLAVTRGVPQTGETAMSAIPSGTRLVSFALSNGVAKAVLSAELEPGGGSCVVSAVRAQIEKTLLQFSAVKKVEISVEGKTKEETLQP